MADSPRQRDWWASHIKQRIDKMNFFYQESETSRSPNAKQMSVMSTRLYIFLLPACLSVLTIFYGLGQQSISETVFSPSLATFEKLEALYPTTISCPCRQIAVPFLNFSSVNFATHQVSLIVLTRSSRFSDSHSGFPYSFSSSFLCRIGVFERVHH